MEVMEPMRESLTWNDRSPHSVSTHIGRGLWNVAWLLLFRPTPKLLWRWRGLLLRVFGARLGPQAYVAASCRIWAPWNLTLEERAAMGEHVDCYNVVAVRVGREATISQYSYLCTATHEFEMPGMPLNAQPIRIGAHAWICADVFIGPGVTVGEGTVVGARSSVFSDLPAWRVCFGTPAQPKRERKLVGRTSRPVGDRIS